MGLIARSAHAELRDLELAGIGTDPDRFERFYSEHLPPVRVFVARRLDDPASVADLTADVFQRAIDSAAGYRADQGPPRVVDRPPRLGGLPGSPAAR